MPSHPALRHRGRFDRVTSRALVTSLDTLTAEALRRGGLLGLFRLQTRQEFRRRLDPNVVSQRGDKWRRLSVTIDARRQPPSRRRRCASRRCVHPRPRRVRRHEASASRSAAGRSWTAMRPKTSSSSRSARRRAKSEFGRQPSGDGVELETAVPRRRRIRDLLLGDCVHQRLRRSALRPEVHQPGEQDARVEKDAHGQRLRSSSTSAAMSRVGRRSPAPSAARPAADRLSRASGQARRAPAERPYRPR